MTFNTINEKQLPLKEKKKKKKKKEKKELKLAFPELLSADLEKALKVSVGRLKYI